jgi:hypothetical protein
VREEFLNRLTPEESEGPGSAIPRWRCEAGLCRGRPRARHDATQVRGADKPLTRDLE